ncbi:MAG TPA: hypothetical protein VKT74_08735 [Gammaproteobacteria bacterium]|nr:hypothetical protein [Gammaproteobacteria bacterium]
MSAIQPALQPTFEYVNRPEISETFSDSIWSIGFDSSTWRIEFTVGRTENAIQGQPPKGHKFTAARLVLTPNAGIELYAKLKELIDAMQASGALKMIPLVPGSMQKQ